MLLTLFLNIKLKFLVWFLRFFKLGHGSTWPGEIALMFQKNFIKRLVDRNNKLKIVLIVGTNGKTTSAKLISHVLAQESYGVFSNSTGANILNGVASSLINNSNISGKIKKDVAIFEIDENVLPLILKQITPTAILALNLFRDQLDRYGEVDIITNKWEKALADSDNKIKLILNAQDPNLFFLGKKLNNIEVLYFGLEENKLEELEPTSEADTIYCPICSSKLKFTKIAYSHVGIFSCPNDGTNENSFEDYSSIVKSSLSGLFNEFNISAVSLLLNKVFNIPLEKISEDLKDFMPAFGRQEIIKYHEKYFIMQLSKNPVGFNQALKLVEKAEQKYAFLILNDGIPDGRDVSWIWDINFDDFIKSVEKIWISGNRAYDMAICIKYAMRNSGIENKSIYVSDNLKSSVEQIVKDTNNDDKIYAIPVYSAMLNLRKILLGDSINAQK